MSKKLADILTALSQQMGFTKMLHLALHVKEIVDLDMEIASQRDPDNEPDKSDLNGKSRRVYCWLVRLGDKDGQGIYLHMDAPPQEGGNVCHASTEVSGANRWTYEGACEIAGGIEESKKNGAFMQLTGKNDHDVSISPAVAYSYEAALCERRASLLKHLQNDLEVTNAVDVFGAEPPTSVADMEARMDVGIDAMKDLVTDQQPTDFTDAMDALNSLGIYKKPGKDQMH